MRITPARLALLVMLVHGLGSWAQKVDAAANQAQARRVLAATIQALGGDAWLNLKSVRDQGRTAGYFQGTPTGVVAETTQTFETPDEFRVDFAGSGHIVQIYRGQQGWEITYKGAKPIPPEKVQEHLRWRDHSLSAALRCWLRDPDTLLIESGPVLTERRQADKVTLIDGHNDAITLEVDASTYLPIRLSFAWRDPRFEGKNLDAVEYDNYQRVSGIQTPFTITRTHNGQTVSQRFRLRVTYNASIPPNFFDPAIEAKRKR
ncbi:MAG TPA: hypothetical protein VFN53_11540 [Acidobacteriaceae bacterium]|nr:hypothetical protein [Acidobacteriaceae bacterium]